MPKMLIFQDAPEYRAAIEAAAPGWEALYVSGAEEAMPLLAGAEILASPPAAVVEKALAIGGLRWVQNWGAGVESLPLDAMRRQGVALTNASGVHGNSISESIFTMALAFARGLRPAISNMPAQSWKRDVPVWEIHGQTMGILGMGAIGAETARLAKALGMRVLGLRRSAASADNVDAMYGPEGLSDLLPQCDIVVNILPLTKQTRRMVGAACFARMKPTACYISVGRGGTTDQPALVEALRNGTIAYAGLDVTTPEPLPPDSPLWDMDNVIITPHISGGTQFYQRRAMEIFLENLAAYVKTGHPVRNVVDLESGY